MDESGFKAGLGKLGSVAKAGLGAATAAIGTTATAIAGLSKLSLDAYGSFEQLTGGIETLFGASADIVKGYAAEAYKTAGMSANQYMETATSFAASLVKGLGGDTKAAAEYANTAITDMSDNTNKMGTSMEMIQNAYQGFAKQNYTMLDNLKLGYGGTQAEMARLINDSGVLGDTMTLTAETVNQVSFDKIVEAIHVVQTEMGITGTTAQEASSTIEGSLRSVKAAWENLMVGFGDENADLGQIFGNLMTSIDTAAQNIIPRVQQIITSIVQVLTDNADQIGSGAAEIVSMLVETIVTSAPQLLEAAGLIILAFARGLIEHIPDLLAQLPQIIADLVQFFADHLDEVVEIGISLLAAIGLGLIQAIPNLVASIPEIITALVEGFAAAVGQFAEIGKMLIDGLWQGIENAASWLVEKITGFVQNIIDKFKELFGIRSPSKETEWIGAMIDQGLVNGILKNRGAVKDAFKQLNFTGELAAKMPQLRASVNGTVNHLVPAYAGAGGVQSSHTVQEINKTTTQTVRVIPDQRGIFKLVKAEETRRGKSLVKQEDR